MEEIDELGLSGMYDFFYLPRDRRNGTNVGYAFVNFENAEAGLLCQRVFTNYRFKRFRSSKVGQLSMAHVQGLENIINHYAGAAVYKFTKIQTLKT